MIKRIINSTKHSFYQRGVRYNYLTPVEKPVTSLAVSSMIELSSEAMQFGYLEMLLVPEVSVMLGAFAFRLALEALGSFFQVKLLLLRDCIRRRRIVGWIVGAIRLSSLISKEMLLFMYFSG